MTPEETTDAESSETLTPPPASLTFEALLSGMDTAQRQVLETHTAGLKTALQAEREARKRLEAQVKTEKAQAEAAKTQAEARATAEAQRATFYATAARQGVRRTSVHLAYVAAQDGGHIHADGTVDWDTIREQFGDLFDGRTTPVGPSHPTSAAAGAGTQADTPETLSINQMIRQAAKR